LTLRDQEITKQYKNLIQNKIRKNKEENLIEDIENQLNWIRQIKTDCTTVIIGNIPIWEGKR